MKKIKYLIISFIITLSLVLCMPFYSQNMASAAVQKQETKKPKLAIVIDDFGGYDQSGVETMLSIDAPLTCAIMPNLDNTKLNSEKAIASNKEVILHMPMQAHVSLPLDWYGPTYIGNYDSKEQIYSKLDNALASVGGASGFNIHIGSGVCQNKETVGYVYDYAKENNLYFLDSRTHMGTICDQVANTHNVVYLGRDEFLEPEGNKSYEGVKRHLLIAAQVAKDKGHAIAIGHVGSHGGENTAKAIKDSIKEIEEMGVEIVPLSTIYKTLQASYVNNTEQNNSLTMK